MQFLGRKEILMKQRKYYLIKLKLIINFYYYDIKKLNKEFRFTITKIN